MKSLNDDRNDLMILNTYLLEYWRVSISSILLKYVDVYNFIIQHIKLNPFN